MDLTGSWRTPLVGSCENDNEPLGYINVKKFINSLATIRSQDRICSVDLAEMLTFKVRSKFYGCCTTSAFTIVAEGTLSLQMSLPWRDFACTHKHYITSVLWGCKPEMPSGRILHLRPVWESRVIRVSGGWTFTFFGCVKFYSIREDLGYTFELQHVSARRPLELSPCLN